MVKSKLSKLALCAAGGAVALATAAGPALAEPPAPVADLGQQSQQNIEEAPDAEAAPRAEARGSEAAPRNPEMAPNTMDVARHSYKGRVIARIGLNIRSHPNTHSRILGSLPYGKVIHIQCKVRGENVRGNHLWYKLDTRHHGHHGHHGHHKDAWVSARYVTNIGPAPHYCHHRR